MSECLQEDCANWDGWGCPCRALDVEPVDVRRANHWDDDEAETHANGED